IIFLFHDTTPTGISTLSLHDALPIWLGGAGIYGRARGGRRRPFPGALPGARRGAAPHARAAAPGTDAPGGGGAPPGADRRHHSTDRKSTRLNSSHVAISYAVFCLKKK